MTERERNSCPSCGSIRIYRRSEENYRCARCGWKGSVPKKIKWYFGIYYKNGGPIVGRSGRCCNVRERSFCPRCMSVRLRKRITTHDYFCDNCKWTGTNPKKMKWGTTTIC